MQKCAFFIKKWQKMSKNGVFLQKNEVLKKVEKMKKYAGQ